MGTKDFKKKQKTNEETSIVGRPFNFYTKNKNFWPSVFLLAIMVLSIAGFALSSGGARSSSSDNSNLPSEIPFQEFTNQETGTPFWGAIRNNEQFIFLSIEGFDNRSDLANLAEAIKIQPSLDIYVDPSFNSAESEYFIDKALRGIKLNNQRILNETCNANTLVLTTNNTLEGDCLIFNPALGEEYKDSEVLVYYLIQ